MEEVQISELNEFTSLQGTDLFVAVDNTVTKKIQYSSITGQLFTDLTIDNITGYTGLVQFATGELGAATGVLNIATGVLSAATGSMRTEYTSDINLLSGAATGRADFVIYGERNGTLPNNDYPFHFGNGNGGGDGHGIVVPFDSEIIALTLDMDVTNTVNVNIQANVDGINNTSSNLTGQITTSQRSIFRKAGGEGEGGALSNSVNPHMTPIPVAAGDTINFHTDYVSDASRVAHTRVAAFIRQKN